MARHPVLIDTNVIIEAHAKGCWNALAGGFQLETVEVCVTETQTGRQRRRPEQQIDEVLLRGVMKIHDVTDVDRAAVLVQSSAQLDPGELDLWAHALTRKDAWILCGPDRASMRFGYDAGFRNRLISLGELLGRIGAKPLAPLNEAYQKAWLEGTINKLVLGVL